MLYNRRFYEEELAKIDIEENLPLTIIMVDVNGLKLVNDSFGHAKGDELIRKVSSVLKRASREQDIIARLGGDEFVVLLPRTNSLEAEQIIKRMKKYAARETVGSIDVSMSFGYQTKLYAYENIEDIYKIAEDHMYKKKLFESPSMRGKTINTIIKTLHETNPVEELHANRVSKLCAQFATALELSEDKIEEIKNVGLLHDIGKIAFDTQSSVFTKDEMKNMERHSEIGYRILSTVNHMSEMAEYILYHHERWDGRGYPKGLKGTAIPFEARIIAIVDFYDDITRPNSDGIVCSEQEAENELKKNAGIKFDPNLVNIFIHKVLRQTK